MHCVSPAEAFESFDLSDFSVSDEHRWYRRALVLKADIASTQTRLVAAPPSNASRLPYFIDAVNRWFPSQTRRLLWIAHWEENTHHFGSSFLTAARRGLGEMRSIDEAPGHVFDAHPYAELDQLELSLEHQTEAGLLAGFLGQLIVTESDGWLIADGCTDRFEVWEGNVLFHSASSERIADARVIIKAFDCGEMR
ncbi:hypothetical protein [Sphingomonas sp. LHG3406-1]|uniref:hypothetical protein n=1 Tax=Sphingomonas sp. LHG3406-1 TaxID=2804617 RepID=UPI002610D3FE|nr:hypothetical protein [Sphingomonas sp. LHG3406-1]